MTYSARDIDPLDAIEVIRFRPALYIGGPDPEHGWCDRLVEFAVHNVAADTPAPTAVRLLLWSAGVLTVAFDGEPLPIELRPFAAAEIPHPDVYRLFMYLAVGGSHHSLGAVVVNALSARLVVSTMHDGVRYRAEFRRGGLVSLLHKVGRTDEVLGTNWITFKPDDAVVPGALTVEQAQRIVGRVATNTPGVAVSMTDRSDEKPGWW